MSHRIPFAALGACALLLACPSFAQAHQGAHQEAHQEALPQETAAPKPRPAERPSQGPSQGPATVQALAKPFLYKITGKGTSAYLYGTVHLTDKRVVTLPPSVAAALDDSDAFFAEIDATAESERKVQLMATMPRELSLDVLVGPDTWRRIENLFIKAGLPAQKAKQMASFEPWAFSTLLPLLDHLEEMSKEPTLDKMLYQRFQKEGKPVAGLETVEEQVAVFQSFTREEQVQMLRDSITMLEEYEAAERDVVEEMIAAWMSGDSATLIQLMDDGFGQDPELRERSEQELIWNRNARFAKRMEAAMTATPDKTNFFAMGVLHFPDAPKLVAVPAANTEGEKAQMASDVKGMTPVPKFGVVELMRQRGYKVTRVGQNRPVPAKAPK